MRFLSALAALIIMASATAIADDSTTSTDASDAITITVNKSPTCGCCKMWIQHLQAEGFLVEALDSDNMTAVKKRYAVPENMQSCHTATVNGYVVEGHVPAKEIRRLLTEKPDATGISVPGMPLGSPGMDGGNRVDDYKVMLFGETGYSVFQDYPAPHSHEESDEHDHTSAADGAD